MGLFDDFEGRKVTSPLFDDIDSRPTPSIVGPSIRRVAGQMVQGAGQALTDIGAPALGEPVRTYGREVVEANPAQVQSLADIPQKPGTFVGEALAEMFPQVAAMLATGKLGALAGGAIGGPPGALAGGIIGGLVPAVVPSYGEIRQKQGETGKENLPLAAGAALGVGALETALGPQRIIGKMVRGGVTDALGTIPAGMGRGQAIARQGVRTGLEEASEEIPQGMLERYAGGQDVATPEALEEYAFGAAKGFVGGAPFGAARGAVAPRQGEAAGQAGEAGPQAPTPPPTVINPSDGPISRAAAQTMPGAPEQPTIEPVQSEPGLPASALFADVQAAPAAQPLPMSAPNLLEAQEAGGTPGSLGVDPFAGIAEQAQAERIPQLEAAIAALQRPPVAQLPRPQEDREAARSVATAPQGTFPEQTGRRPIPPVPFDQVASASQRRIEQSQQSVAQAERVAEPSLTPQPAAAQGTVSAAAQASEASQSPGSARSAVEGRQKDQVADALPTPQSLDTGASIPKRETGSLQRDTETLSIADQPAPGTPLASRGTRQERPFATPRTEAVQGTETGRIRRQASRLGTPPARSAELVSPGSAAIASPSTPETLALPSPRQAAAQVREGLVAQGREAAAQAASQSSQRSPANQSRPLLQAKSSPSQPSSVRGPSSSPVDQAAHEAATSEINTLPQPSDAQIAAGNYKHGHVRVGGLDISVENPDGSTRSGTSPSGKPWSRTMQGVHYGGIKRTKGRDGDAVDVFVKAGTPEQWTGPVFVIDQETQSGRFDEHKSVIGANDQKEAIALYKAQYDKGSAHFRGVTQMTMPQFKTWLRTGDTTKRAFGTKLPQIKSEDTSIRSTAARKYYPEDTSSNEVTHAKKEQGSRRNIVEQSDLQELGSHDPAVLQSEQQAMGRLRREGDSYPRRVEKKLPVVQETSRREAESRPQFGEDQQRSGVSSRERKVGDAPGATKQYEKEQTLDGARQDNASEKLVSSSWVERQRTTEAPEPDAGRSGASTKDGGIATHIKQGTAEPASDEVIREVAQKPKVDRKEALRLIDEAAARAPTRKADDSVLFTRLVSSGGRKEQSAFFSDRSNPVDSLTIRESANGNWDVIAKRGKREDQDPKDKRIPGLGLTVYRGSSLQDAQSKARMMLSGARIDEQTGEPSYGKPERPGGAFITIEIPGDGKFRILNDRDRIAAFRKKFENALRPGKPDTYRDLRPESALNQPAEKVKPDEGEEPPKFARAPVTETEAFKRWFGNSKVVNDDGNPRVVYHGTQRPDRIDSRFRKSRATSGPMAFFTDDPAIASNYATGKSDTSLADEDSDYASWFKYKPSNSRSKVSIDRAWFFLPSDTKATIADRAPRITRDDDGNIFLADEDRSGLGGYDQHIKEARGNHLKALVEEWLNSAALFNDEQQFLKVLRLAGLADVEIDSPNASYSGVFPVYLSIQNPLETSAIPDSVVAELERASRRQRMPRDTGGDIWDKRNRSPSVWIDALKADIASGKSSHAWTSIPDWVTETLKRLGYDGIHDTGGKLGGDTHSVWIPFEENQVKSATGNKGTFNPDKKDIRFSRQASTGMPRTDTQREVDRLAQSWKNAPKINVVETPADLPFPAPDDARGAFFRGQVYIVASNNANAEEVQQTLFHETLGHFGLRGVLGDKLGLALLQLAARNKTIRDAAERWKRNNPQGNLSSAGWNALAAEEALANVAGTGEQINGLGRFMAVVQRMLRAIGLGRVADWFEGHTNLEAMSLLADARKFVESGPHIYEGSLAAKWSRPEEARISEPFYSELARQVDAIKMNTAPAAQWKATIAGLKQKGVKADEIEWSGINEWLDLQQGKVTRDQIGEYLRGNGIQVTETELGGTLRDRAKAVVQRHDNLGFDSHTQALNAVRKHADWRDRWEVDTDADAAILDEFRNAPQGADIAGATKFAEYQLPGGTNYRELLLTLPNQESIELGVDDKGRKSWVSKKARDDFRSSHFDQPNILAHVRFNERTDADGKRVLFIEEIQSDWGQAAKRSGFKPQRRGDEMPPGFTLIDDAELARKDGLAVPPDEVGPWFYQGPGIQSRVFRERADAINEAWKDASGKYDSRPPSAPFVGKTDAWVALALKRMIRYAAENGFDRVAWTTGEQQAARYDLSQQVELIDWKMVQDSNSATRRVFVKTNNRERSFQFRITDDGIVVGDRKDGLEGKHVSDVVGKEVAKKIMASPSGELRGDGLRVGGEGMQAFYDRIVPNVANDVLKKLGGARVGVVDLGGADRILRHDLIRERRVLPDNDPRREVLSGEIDRLARLEVLGQGAMPQPSFDITPALRERAMQGMPLFSRSSDTATRAGQVLADLFNRPGVFGPLARSLQTQYHKATKSPEFRRVWERAHQMFQDAASAMTRAADLAPTLLPKFDAGNIRDAFAATFTGKGRADLADIRTVSNVLNKSTVLGGGDPLKGKRWTDEQLRAGVDLRDGGAPVKLTETQIRMYNEARDAIDASLAEQAAAEAWALARLHLGSEQLRKQVAAAPGEARDLIVGALNLAKGAAQAQGLEKEANAIADTIKRVDEKFTKADALQRAGYMPLQRFGKYRIAVTFPDAATRGDDPLTYVSRYESNFEANRAHRELEKRFANVPGAVVGKVTEEDIEKWKLFKGVNPDTVMMFAEEAGIDADDVMQTWYKEVTGSRSALRHMIQRHGYAGYSDDLPRVLASFITSAGKRTGYTYHLADMMRMVREPMPGEVAREARELVETIQSPNDAGATGRSLMAAWYLLGSPASALVNMTQTITMTLPWLSQFGARGFSPTEAGRALAGAYSKVIGRGEMSADLKAAMRRAEQDGTVDSNEVFHLYAESMKPLIARLGSGGAAFRARAFMTLWGAPFAIAEKLNRRATFVAAYDLARGQGKGAGEAFSFAERAVHETQGIYASYNRPNWARGPIGGMALIFKQFSISYLEMLSRMARSGPEGRKAAGLALGILFMAAGLSGLPGEDDLLDLIDTVAQTIFGKPFLSKMALRNALEDTLGRELGQFVQSGVSAFLPLDVSARMGMGNLLPGTALLKPSEQRKGQEALEALGVAGSFGKALVDASEAILAGDLTRALKQAAPKAVGDVIKGFEIAATGEIRDARGKKIIEGTPIDAAIQSVGFQPRGKAEVQAKIANVTELVGYHKKVESSIADEWARGIVDRSQEKVEAARRRLTEWNQRNPETMIIITPQQIIQRTRALREEKAGRIARTAPRELRGLVAEEFR